MALPPDSKGVNRGRVTHSKAIPLFEWVRSLLIAAVLVIGPGTSAVFAQCFAGNGTVSHGCSIFIAPTGGDATALGNLDTLATGFFATAYGADANAIGDSATATGPNVWASGATATATGGNSSAIGDSATATGGHSAASGEFATATGGNSSATGAGATATGGYSAANGEFATATGNSSIATGDKATATGHASTANGLTASAYGDSSSATGDQTTAIGQASVANGNGATALGANSLAQGTGAVAIGNNAAATGTNAIAIGNGAEATFANSSAFGTGATTSAANQMSFGTTSNTYRMSGIASAASLAAQSGPTSFVTSDAAGNLAVSKFSPLDISTLQSNVGVLQSQVGLLQTQMRQAFEGTAIAIAMGGSALPSDKKFAVSTNYGNFRGESAISIGAQMRLTEYAVANFGIASGLQQHGTGTRAGLTFAW
jgi:trimeric autotransporter adhesin